MAEAEKSDVMSTGWSFVVIVVLYLIGAGIYQAYKFIDRQGYISHTVETSITADGSWLVGETKNCASYPIAKELAATLHQDAGYALNPISCDSGPAHNVKVMFYGRKVQKGHFEAEWSCTRNSVSIFNDNAFTCKQTGALKND